MGLKRKLLAGLRRRREDPPTAPTGAPEVREEEEGVMMEETVEEGIPSAPVQPQGAPGDDEEAMEDAPAVAGEGGEEEEEGDASAAQGGARRPKVSLKLNVDDHFSFFT